MGGPIYLQRRVLTKVEGLQRSKDKYDTIWNAARLGFLATWLSDVFLVAKNEKNRQIHDENATYRSSKYPAVQGSVRASITNLSVSEHVVPLVDERLQPLFIAEFWVLLLDALLGGLVEVLRQTPAPFAKRSRVICERYSGRF